MSYESELQAVGQRADDEIAGLIIQREAAIAERDFAIQQRDEALAERDAVQQAFDDHMMLLAPAGHPEAPDPPDLPLVTPISSQKVHEGYGWCQHVNFQTTVYKHQTELLERYGQVGVHQMRSMYAQQLSNFDDALAGCRANNVKWNALVATVGESKTTIDTKIAHMAANAADVIYWVEGINEPNEGSSWVAPTVQRQQWIYQAVRSHPELDHVLVLGPSMHDVRLDNSNGAHWQQLVDAGIKQFMDICAVHCYPSGSVPDTKRSERVQWVYDAFGDGYPIKFSEWGYTNTLGLPKSSRVGGHKPTSEQASAVYDCQGVLDFGAHDWELMRYEALNDPDSANLVTEANFGLYRVQTVDGNPDSTWTPKPVIAPLTELLQFLKDPGEPYQVTPVPLELNTPDNVRSVVTQKRDGSTTAWLWLTDPIWDPGTEKMITVNPVSVTVTDEEGSREVSVTPMPVSVDVRMNN